MSKYGTPMYTAPQHAHTWVTVEERGKPAQFKRWRGRSCKSIRKAAKKFYPEDVRLRFGACVYITD